VCGLPSPAPKPDSGGTRQCSHPPSDRLTGLLVLLVAELVVDHLIGRDVRVDVGVDGRIGLRCGAGTSGSGRPLPRSCERGRSPARAASATRGDAGRRASSAPSRRGPCGSSTASGATVATSGRRAERRTAPRRSPPRRGRTTRFSAPQDRDVLWSKQQCVGVAPHRRAPLTGRGTQTRSTKETIEIPGVRTWFESRVPVGVGRADRFCGIGRAQRTVNASVPNGA
jgi:hypothetical protein